MPASLDGKLVDAISSRALFDLDFDAHLLLRANPEDVRNALATGHVPFGVANQK